MVTLQWDDEPIIGEVLGAFGDLVGLYESECTKVISEPGAFPNYHNPDADIIDSDRLRSSVQTQFLSPSEAEISWPVEYSAYVHEGYVMRNGRVIEGRPWTEEAKSRLDLNAKMSLLLALRGIS